MGGFRWDTERTKVIHVATEVKDMSTFNTYDPADSTVRYDVDMPLTTGARFHQ